MNKVPVYLRVSFRDRLLTLLQHYDAKHRFECDECDEEFTTEAARDEVQSFCQFLEQVLTQSLSTAMKSIAR